MARVKPSTATAVGTALARIKRDPRMGAGMKTMSRRRADFGDRLEMELAGAAATPEARALLEDELDRSWRRSADRRRGATALSADEVVVGAGLHGAIYAAARVAAGFPPPLLLESGRVGGSFACSRRPSFYLNSRNRPGRNAGPLDDGGLNWVPGAPVQAMHLSGEKFHNNADLALVIRLTVAMHAPVAFLEARAVERAKPPRASRRYEVVTDKGPVLTDRVLDARGLGAPRTPGRGDGKRVLTFPQLMALADQDFPLRGVRRAAVVGSGDSAKCAAEMLLGLAPAHPMAATALDWVEQVDMYGPGLPGTVEEWRVTQRGRYQAMGSFLRPLVGGAPRLRVFREKVDAYPTLGGARVRGRTYDLAVFAAGLALEPLAGLSDRKAAALQGGTQPPVAYAVPGEELYVIGAAGRPPFTDAEAFDGTSSRPELDSALFRLGDATASLATGLGKPRGSAATKRELTRVARRVSSRAPSVTVASVTVGAASLDGLPDDLPLTAAVGDSLTVEAAVLDQLDDELPLTTVLSFAPNTQPGG